MVEEREMHIDRQVGRQGRVDAQAAGVEKNNTHKESDQERV